jgi:hypothetical protein
MNIKGKASWFLKASSHYVTMWIAYRYAKDFPQYFVVGFPRSGTSWLSEIVADYYNLPRPRHYYLPVAFAAVLHTHFKPNQKFTNTFYIYRDGRDSYASSYFKSLRLMKEDPGFVRTALYTKLFKGRTEDLSPEDHRENFLAFMKEEYRRGYIWSAHIDEWQQEAKTNQGITILTFEGLLGDSENEMSQAINQISGSVDKKVLNQVVFKNSFEQQINRPKEQHRTILRKGKKNSWKECFSREAAAFFTASCGKKLVELGYESDDSWISEFPSINEITT